MSTENLWGELPTESAIKTPVTILKEQATILGDSTNKILVGEVTTGQDMTIPKGIILKDPRFDFVYHLSIVAPALGNYRYTVLQIGHKIDSYPVTVTDISLDSEVACLNEQEYIEALKKVLSSERVHRVISSLLSQSKAA